MARLPIPGNDNGSWGNILNDYLSQSLKPDGTIKDNAVTANTIAPNAVTNAAIASDAVNATSIADGSITNILLADATVQESKLSSAVQTKLNQTAPVTSVAGKTGVVTLVSTDVGLGNVDNTSDANKPISSATQTALNAKAPLANPTFTGTVTVPTPSNSTDAATRGYTDDAITALASTYQPLDSDLTAIAALTTTSFGRSLLAQANANTTRVALGAMDANFITVGEESVSRDLSSGAASMTSGSLRLRYFTARKTETITQLRAMTQSTAAGATPTLCRMGIYSVDGSGNLTLVAAIPNDTSLFAATNTAYTRSLSASWSKVAGTRYAAGILVVTAAAIPLLYCNSGVGPSAGVAPRTSGAVSGQTDLPASVSVGLIADSALGPYMEMLP